MGRRICMARYGAPLNALMKARGFWSLKLWERSFVALEAGLMKGEVYEKATIKKDDVDKAAASSTSGPPALALHDKAIRGAGNAVLMSQMTLEIPKHQMAMLALCASAQGRSLHPPPSR